jgi:hypothetical protein
MIDLPSSALGYTFCQGQIVLDSSNKGHTPLQSII